MEPNLISFEDDDDDHHVSSLPHPERPAGFDNVFFPSSNSSSSDEDPVDEEEEPNWSMEATSRRLDSMIHFLDQRLLTPSSESPDSPLPEFIATAGGVFDPPRRSAVHPSRPPPLELRPRPSRESQVGRSLRALAASPSHLCAAREDGSLLSWPLPDLAPTASRLSYPPSPVTSLLPDAATATFWTGHHDGRIRCWKASARAFKECLSWVAHRGPVLSLIISTYGDLWSGSEGGSLKIWPWEALHKSLSSTPEELHMAALFVERSYVDLKAQVAATAICNALNSDVRYLVSDHSRAKVWSAGFLSFALWDSRTRELLKVFNIDGQLERMDFLSGQEFVVEDEEMRTRVVAAPKKEKTPPQLGFFQRSRNALIGAADAVRRVAAKGGLGDDIHKTEALIATPDGIIWSGCTNGLLVQWDGNGHRLQDFHYHSFAVQCFSSFGSRLWVGYASGILQVLDLEGHILGGWVAHSSPIIKMAVGAQYVFTLANHGGIRGWNVVSPGPLDSILRTQLARRELLYARIETVKVLAGTWNVAQERASPDSLISWLGSAAGDVGLVVVGLQEVEMGAGVLAMSAAKETVGLEGSSLGQWWLDMIGKTLDEGSAFERVGSRQLAGLLVALWVRCDLKDYVGDVDAAAVPCGFGRAIGNKGAVALKIRIYGRTMCFVNCHFAAHQEAVSRRNADFDHVYRTMTFGRASNYFNAAAAGASSVQTFRIPNSIGTNPSEGVPELSQADMIIFLGDFNYRLSGISYDEARDFISQRSFDWLKEKDQLRTEMEAGNVFQGMREAVIRFPPTYKFDKYQPGLSGYDSGEKKRVPAWCDRILYRDSRFAGMSTCSLDCPIVSEISEYDACMDVTDSDHKPVRCVFSVDVARVDESVRRKEFADIVKSDEARGVLQKLCVIPETIVSTNNIILQNQDTSVLRITNKSDKDEALFEIICEGQAEINEDGQAFDHHPRGSFGFPRWLEAIPATGTIKPGQIAEVSVHLEDFPTLEEFVDGVPRNSWCEDTRDEEAILIVKVRGTYTTIETRDHRIRVRHCCSALTTRGKPKSNGARLVRGSVLPRSDYQQFSGSYDVVNHLRNLRSP